MPAVFTPAQEARVREIVAEVLEATQATAREFAERRRIRIEELRRDGRSPLEIYDDPELWVA
jgi:hypothetical protein